MTVRPLESLSSSAVLSVPPLLPDAPDVSRTRAVAPAPTQGSFASALAEAFRGAESALVRADGAERAFAAGRGGLQEMVLQRAQAEVTLSVASAAASRAAQALTTILGMQV